MSEPVSVQAWLRAMPKVELHVHIDGTLQPARLLRQAVKHGVSLPYDSQEAVERACEFSDLQSFLDMYYLGTSVLREEDDFYHLMWDYLLKCREQNILHCEIMVEPQSYLTEGVSLAAMMAGFNQAIKDAEEAWDQSVLLILSFLRHRPESEALALLEQVKSEYPLDFVAIGLASAEAGNPPQQFVRLYERARALGYRLTAHAGEEGPAAYVRDSLDLLGVERIDHGVRCLEDLALTERLRQSKVPLTVCPLSNVSLRVFPSLSGHALPALLDAGLMVTLNSDDPAYFGGFLNENFLAVQEALGLSPEQLLVLNRNAFEACFLPERQKAYLLGELDNYLKHCPCPQ